MKIKPRHPEKVKNPVNPIKKKPKWISYEDNRAGYDVLSWDKEQNEIFIEVKSTNNSTGLFYLTKGEWRVSIAKKQKYFMYEMLENIFYCIFLKMQ